MLNWDLKPDLAESFSLILCCLEILLFGTYVTLAKMRAVAVQFPPRSAQKMKPMRDCLLLVAKLLPERQVLSVDAQSRGDRQQGNGKREADRPKVTEGRDSQGVLPGVGQPWVEVTFLERRGTEGDSTPCLRPLRFIS